MDELSTFRATCEQVRFPQDRPAPRPPGGRSAVADLVARVRATGLQATPSTIPAVAAAVGTVASAVGLEASAEVYVVNSPEPNAFVPVAADQRRPVVILHSALVSLLDTRELAFAVGHEFGHLGLGHAHQPVEVAQSEFEALQLRATQRVAELSADRVGLVATRSVSIAGRVMVKVASGLSTEQLGLDVDAFVRQMERDPAETSRRWELDLSHPSLPFRLWALLRFSHSDVYARLSGQAANGVPIADIDAEITERLKTFGDGALDVMEERIVTTALLWAAVLLVLEDDTIEDHERMGLDALVGEDMAAKGIAFATDHGVTSVREKLGDALGRLRHGGPAGVARFMASLDAFSFVLGVERDRTIVGVMVRDVLNGSVRTGREVEPR